MTRSELYTRAVACAFAELPPEHRREAWACLEAEFRQAFLREHPIATEEQVSAAFLTMARRISARMTR